MQRLETLQRIYPKQFDKYLQSIFEETLQQLPQRPQSSLLYFDMNYLYTFDVADIPYIRKFTDIIRISSILVKEGNQYVRRNPKAIEWMDYLERWCQGETVNLWDKQIKPIQIERTMDRVVAEFMIRIASAMAGFGDFAPMKFHAIGDGAEAGTTPSPSDTALVSELDRIDVTSQVGGGGITVDGSTFMCIGNHDVFSPSGDLTEMGMFDAELPATGEEEEQIIDDRMGDHSIFPDEVEHISGSDAPGGTIVVYQCSS